MLEKRGLLFECRPKIDKSFFYRGFLFSTRHHILCGYSGVGFKFTDYVFSSYGYEVITSGGNGNIVGILKQHLSDNIIVK